MQTISGKGKLYRSDTNQFIALVTYSIRLRQPTEGTRGGWEGSLRPIMDSEVSSLIRLCTENPGISLMLELEDGRKRGIILTGPGDKRIFFLGSGPLE